MMKTSSTLLSTGLNPIHIFDKHLVYRLRIDFLLYICIEEESSLIGSIVYYGKKKEFTPVAHDT